MINVLGKLPHKLGVAFSGGVDSVAVVDFLARDPRREIVLLHFDHGDPIAKDEREITLEYAKKYNLQVLTDKISRDRKKKESLEEYWRIERYKFLQSVDFPVITCHHLDDVVETWILSAINGQTKTIKYQHNNVIRPFLTTRKREFIKWCTNNKLRWIEDYTNNDVARPRNRVRHNIIPEIELINPGIHKVVYKRVMFDYEQFLTMDKLPTGYTYE